MPPDDLPLSNLEGKVILDVLNEIKQSTSKIPEMAADLRVMKTEADNHWETTAQLKLDVMQNKSMQDEANVRIHERIDAQSRWIHMMTGGGVLLGAGISYLISIAIALGADYIKQREDYARMVIRLEQKMDKYENRANPSQQ